MQPIMERHHTDLLDSIESKSLGSTKVQTTSFHTTNEPKIMCEGIFEGDEIVLLMW
jgi:hypothetical protein